MVRVLQVIGNMNAGGMETMIMNYYQNIDREKVQFDFLLFNLDSCLFEDNIKKLGGKIYRVIPRRDSFFKNRKQLREFFRSHHYEVAEFHQGITYFYPLKMAKKYGVKNRIVHCHGIDAKFLKKLKLYNNLYAKRRISSLANHYFTCSRDVENHLFSKKVIDSKKIVLVNNAIDLQQFKFSLENRKKVRKEFKVNDEELFIGHVGSFTSPKNHKFLLEIFAEIVKLGKQVKFLLVGSGYLEEQIRQQINDYGLNDKVIITGNRKDVNEILSALDVFVFPSLFEGLPLSLIEAQTSGLSVFMSDTINSKVKLTDDCHILHLHDSASDWAQKIVSYKPKLKRDDSFKIMKKTDYNIAKEAKKLEKIYLEIAGKQ